MIWHGTLFEMREYANLDICKYANLLSQEKMVKSKPRSAWTELMQYFNLVDFVLRQRRLGQGPKT